MSVSLRTSKDLCRNLPNLLPVGSASKPLLQSVVTK